MIDIAPGAAAFHLDGAGDRIDTYALQPRQVNDQAVITGAQPGAIVAPPGRRPGAGACTQT